MATSGSYDYTRTAGDIIHAALRKLGLVADGEVASTSQNVDALVDLNLLVKSWPAKGIDLWRNVELTVYLDTTSQSYSVGATGDNATFTGYKTEIATAAVTGASTVTVDSDANITNGDVIGVELDDGTIQWTTVNGVPAADVVTLTNVLTDDVAVDNHVYNYTSIAQRPLRLYDGRLIQEDNTEIPLTQISRTDYKNLPTKSSTGKPTQFYYDPQLDNGTIFIWPVANTVQDRLLFTAQRQLQDLDLSTDNLDFPQEWLRALVYNLAVELSFDYNIATINPQLLQSIKEHAALLLEDVEDFDVENVSIQFTPEAY